MKMHPRTIATLQHLRDVEWFCNVGLYSAGSAKTVSSWSEALESCKSIEWENIRLKAANGYRERLLMAKPDVFSKWNELVRKVKPFSEELVHEKVKATIAIYDLDKDFISSVDWDILHLLMESELSDVQPPSFYSGQAYWYVEGHFPCGWTGQSLTDGRPIIY